MLQFAHQNGCAWCANTCEAAVRGGHLAVLQYAHQNGCEWGPKVCSEAARKGNLSMLKWLRRHGCPWDCWTHYSAAYWDHLEILKWARQQCPPCPWWSQSCTAYHALIGHPLRPSMLVFLQQQQAPLSAGHLAQARAAATEMTYAVLSLRAALPEKTPHEVTQNIVNLACT